MFDDKHACFVCESVRPCGKSGRDFEFDFIAVGVVRSYVHSAMSPRLKARQFHLCVFFEKKGKKQTEALHGVGCMTLVLKGC